MGRLGTARHRFVSFVLFRYLDFNHRTDTRYFLHHQCGACLLSLTRGVPGQLAVLLGQLRGSITKDLDENSGKGILNENKEHAHAKKYLKAVTSLTKCV